MPDNLQLTPHHIDQSRGDLYAIAGKIEAIKLRIAALPSRDYVSRLARMEACSVWVMIVSVEMVFAR
jgi:hypothetical protein